MDKDVMPRESQNDSMQKKPTVQQTTGLQTKQERAKLLFELDLSGINDSQIAEVIGMTPREEDEIEIMANVMKIINTKL